MEIEQIYNSNNINTNLTLIHNNNTNISEQLLINWVSLNIQSGHSGYLQLVIYNYTVENPSTPNIIETLFVNCCSSVINLNRRITLEPNYKFGVIKDLESNLTVNYSYITSNN